MGVVFVNITQIRNLTRHWIGFRVRNGVPIRNLPPYKTGIVKQNRIRRRCLELYGHWNIGILINGDYTGIEISSVDVLKYVQIVFRYEKDVFRVELKPENCSSDYLFRQRYFGFMRNPCWDNRPIDPTKSTELRQTAWREKNHQKHEQKATYEEGKKDDNPDSTNHKKLVEKVPNSNMKAKLLKGELNVSSTTVPPEKQRPRNEERILPPPPSRKAFISNASSPDHGLNSGSGHHLISSKVPESERGSGSPRAGRHTNRRLPSSTRISSDCHYTDNHETLEKVPSSNVTAKSVDQLKKHDKLNASTDVPPLEQRRHIYEEKIIINRLAFQHPPSSGIRPRHAFNSPENGPFSITSEEEVTERRPGTSTQIPPSTREEQRNPDMERRSSHLPGFHNHMDSFVHALLLLLAFTIVLLVHMLI